MSDSATARAVVLRGLQVAEEMNVAVSVAVVDAAGFLVALARSDGAKPYSSDVAAAKAYTVIFTGQPSAQMRELAQQRPEHFHAIARLSARSLIPSPGGIPFADGAIGVSGASPEQDATIADDALRWVAKERVGIDRNRPATWEHEDLKSAIREVEKLRGANFDSRSLDAIRRVFREERGSGDGSTQWRDGWRRLKDALLAATRGHPGAMETPPPDLVVDGEQFRSLWTSSRSRGPEPPHGDE